MKQYLRLVGLSIRRKRKASNLTLPALADKAGISKGALSQIENKPCNVCLETLWKLAGALKVSINDLLP